MSEMMEFPKTWEEYKRLYSFRDKEEVYTNGSELMQILRIEQWLEHIENKRKYKQQATGASDCINRQEILRTLPNLCIGFDCLYCPFHNGDDVARNCLLEQWANSLPSAQPEIIRCKDCAGYTGIDHAWGTCLVHKDCVGKRVCKAEDYCSWAERREE